VDDATMLRLLDRVADAPERARAEAHLRECDACAVAYAELQDGSARVRTALDEAFGDPPVPPLAPRRARRGPASFGRLAWRTAAVLALGGGALAAMSPGARARAARLVASLRGAPGAEPRDRADAVRVAAPGPLPVAERVLAAFAPAGEALRVEVEGERLAGALHVELRDTAVAVLSSAGAGGTFGVVVLPSAMRVRAPAAADAQLRLVVPRRLRTLEVRVDGVTRLLMRPAAHAATAAAAVVVPLAPR
jgi:hypothetical protein